MHQGKDLAPIIAGTTVGLLISYKLLKSMLNGNKLYKEIPVPNSKYPYFGHMLSLGKLPWVTISEWHKKLGSIIKMNMGSQIWISIDDPILAHKLLATHGAKTSQRAESTYNYNIYGKNGKGMVFSMPDHNWKTNRAAVVAAIAPSKIECHISAIENEAKNLVNRLLEATEKSGNKGVDPFRYIQLYVMNTVVLIGFGKTYTSLQDPEFIQLCDLIDEGVKLGGISYDLPSFLFGFSFFEKFSGTRAYMKNFIKERRDPIFRKMIKEALQTDTPSLIKYFKENHSDISEDETIVTLTDLVGAGTDTASVFLTWVVSIMCHYPQVQKKVYGEIDPFVERNGRLPVFSERLQFPFCISLMKECMRYRPITPFGIPHVVNKDVEIEGFLIPKGATIITNMVTLHKNPNFYPDRPNEFLPERYMNTLGTTFAYSNGKVEERDHFNFGWGRRICPGINLTEIETFTGFMELMSRCFIEPGEDGMPNITDTRDGGIAILPTPYKVKFTKRTNLLATTKETLHQL